MKSWKDYREKGDIRDREKGDIRDLDMHSVRIAVIPCYSTVAIEACARKPHEQSVAITIMNGWYFIRYRY